MTDKQTKEQGATAIAHDADWTPVLFAQSTEEAEHYRVMLVAEGISTTLGEARKGVRGASGIPLLVPAEMQTAATEVVACKDAIGADWDEDEADDDDDDFLDDDDEDDDDDDDDEDEDDDFVPDDDDDSEEEEEFDSDLED